MNKLFTFLFFLISFQGISQSKVNLSYNFKTGDNYIVTEDIFSQSTQEVAGSPQEISTNQFIKYTLSFSENPKVSSNYNILLKFNKITSLVNQSGYKQFFSSDSSDNEISKMFYHFTDKSLNYQLSNKGHLFLDYTIDSLFSDTSETKQKYIFSQSVEQKLIIDLPVSIVFPDSLIQTGGSWIIKDTISSGIFIFYNQIYTLDSVSEKDYFISKHSDFSTDKTNDVPMNRVYINYDVKGKLTGNYILDRKTCIIRSGEISQNGDGIVNMKYTQNSDPAYSWKMTVNNIVKLKTDKIITH